MPIPKLEVTHDDAIKHKKVLPAKSVTMKRNRTVIVDNQPNLEAEHTPPIIIQPIVEQVLNQHAIF